MSFLSGSLAFQRFRVEGAKPRLFDETHLNRLKDYVAGRDKPAAPDGVETGWAGGRHIWDKDFTQEKNVYTDHLLFDYCAQTDRFPPERFKAYYETELKALSKDNPSGLPSMRQKREAKSIARERLEQEAKDGRYRKWKLAPCMWDAVNNTAFLGSTSGADGVRFQRLWEQTFCASLTQQEQLGGKLEPIDAAGLAMALYPAAEHESLSPFVEGVTPDDRPAWCASDTVPQFLGNEFLLWLWYYSECEGDTLSLPDGSKVTFMLQGGLRLECPRGTTGSGTLNADAAVRLPEARAAAKAGKLPRKAAFHVANAGDTFSFIIQAETLALSSIKLPPPAAEGDQRAREEDRLQHVRDLAAIVDQMFAAFMHRRMTSYWTQEVQEMGAWLKGVRPSRLAA
ncbi:Uncharacterized protein OS=Rhodopirellula sallentina SM41 GN=RSSM_00033 PE=4 SV=1 [Gemmata massiliana]|uniref:Uncharacterized protein n=1 Tax=Gemmata massiliana TaxID=1210884 RepID=A0A6P2DLC2_9BACT|nr:hypothetical protein [Gemmata massiliana]VTS03614.1 Uncharacterized protein OS=Rhodopirellula sallentina SM41 GN=RSSM_00033 PE=4 SV=1 [Gemmata massiliana]